MEQKTNKGMPFSLWVLLLIAGFPMLCGIPFGAGLAAQDCPYVYWPIWILLGFGLPALLHRDNWCDVTIVSTAVFILAINAQALYGYLEPIRSLKQVDMPIWHLIHLPSSILIVWLVIQPVFTFRFED